MLLRKRNSLLLLCLLCACCQKVDLTVEPNDKETADNSIDVSSIIGTGEGTSQRPYTVTDICSLERPSSEAVWVIGYMMGTAPRSMNNAVFSIEADNQSNILLSSDSLCTDINLCIPVELSSAKNKTSFSLPANTSHFQKCLLVKGIPSTYLYRKGLRNVSAGLWLDGFDISSVAPSEWGSIILQQP
ncbi:MAG: hypothetical protein J5733_01075 [Bacteroidaceae bacterium]|nr:hypothetical protein [Bacteroidaceae bacterium]